MEADLEETQNNSPEMRQTKRRHAGLRAPGERKDHLARNFQEGFVETPDHVALHYALYGHRGPILVLCDGIGCDGYIWKYLLPDLAKTYRVLHWQYRGHGQSSMPKTYRSLTIAQMALDLNEILQELVVEPVVLLGHSMGVQVILEFHKRFPEKVCALIPICGAPGHSLDNFMHSTVLKRLFPYVLLFFRSAPGFISEFFWNTSLGNPQGYYPALLLQLTSSLCAKEDLQPYLDHMSRIDARVFLELAKDMGAHTTLDHLHKITVPTLVFAGTRDNFTPIAESRVIAEKIDGAEFCEVPGGTHTTPLEIPELLLLRIRKFLEERAFSPEI